MVAMNIMASQSVKTFVQKNIRNGCKVISLHYYSRDENNERIAIFKEGTNILRNWIEESKQAISSRKEQSTSLSEAIETLSHEIESQTAYLNELKAKQEESEPVASVFLLLINDGIGQTHVRPYSISTFI